MSELDPNHDPVAYTEKVIRGFHEMHDKTVKQADEIVSRYKGENPSAAKLGLDKLDDLAVRIGRYIEEASDGVWPKQVLSILRATMNHLVHCKDIVQYTKRAFDVIDAANLGLRKAASVVH
jgi:hypothetical protein